MPYTYILFSAKLNKYYVGACIDMNRVCMSIILVIQNLLRWVYLEIVYKE